MHKMMERDWPRHFVFKMIVIATLLLAGGSAVARAATIDFSTATNPFTSYTENGFTVTVWSGTWTIASGAAMDLSNTIGAIDVTGAGDFTFSSIDLMQNGNEAQYAITGILGGNTVFIMYGAFPSSGHWATATNTDYASQLIDTLRIKPDTHLTSVDNIVVNPTSSTPEPGTVALIGCGLGALGLARFRRFRASR